MQVFLDLCNGYLQIEFYLSLGFFNSIFLLSFPLFFGIIDWSPSSIPPEKRQSFDLHLNLCQHSNTALNLCSILSCRGGEGWRWAMFSCSCWFIWLFLLYKFVCMNMTLTSVNFTWPYRPLSWFASISLFFLFLSEVFVYSFWGRGFPSKSTALLCILFTYVFTSLPHIGHLETNKLNSDWAHSLALGPSCASIILNSSGNEKRCLIQILY